MRDLQDQKKKAEHIFLHVPFCVIENRHHLNMSPQKKTPKQE